jgi:serine phosphatase RsbU (regulator of sigma subunit)
LREIQSGGDPLGAHEEATFETEALPVEAGQRLFLFTAGLTEHGTVAPPAGGIAAFKNHLLHHHEKPLAEAVAEAAQALQTSLQPIGRRDQLLLALEC